VTNADRVRWDQKYADGHHVGDEPDSFVLRMLADAQPVAASARALDVACGCGRHAIALSDLGFQVDAFDISPAALAIARERAGDRRIRFVESDLDHPRFERSSYAVIVSVEFSSADLAPALIDALAPGGLLIHVARPRACCSYGPGSGELREWYAGLDPVLYEEHADRVHFAGRRR